jgi:hypothetical protein
MNGPSSNGRAVQENGQLGREADSENGARVLMLCQSFEVAGNRQKWDARSEVKHRFQTACTVALLSMPLDRA